MESILSLKIVDSIWSLSRTEFTPHHDAGMRGRNDNITFPQQELIKSLQRIGEFKVDRQSWGTILGTLEGIRFSIFTYQYRVLYPYKSIFDINILDLRDIAAMKIDAIGARGLRRDFIDLYFMCPQDLSLPKAISFYKRKYGKVSSNIVHIQKSLVCFVDAEDSRMPKMLKRVSWEKVKRYFEEEVKKIAGR